MRDVAIVGVGHAGFAPITSGLSYKEQTFEAALRAYDDVGINPRKDVDSFVAVSEDLWEGTSIFDEYVPDQIGAALRPVHTVSADGLYAVADPARTPKEVALSPGTKIALREQLGKVLRYLNQASLGAILVGAADLLEATAI